MFRFYQIDDDWNKKLFLGDSVDRKEDLVEYLGPETCKYLTLAARQSGKACLKFKTCKVFCIYQKPITCNC